MTEYMLKDFLQKAFGNHFALGSFNLDSLETLKALSKAADNLHAPVLAEVSPGEVEYLGIHNLASLVDNAKRNLGIPLFLNLDHAADLDKIEQALDFGFDLVHFDGSKLPLEENIAKAKQVVEMAHRKNILVEGEMDHFPGASELNPASQPINLTDPESAKEFVHVTGIDIFAVSIGNKHGFYTDGSKKLNIELLEKIRVALPNTFFSLHGGSGAPDQEVKQAISLGVVKVNINSELRIAWRDALESSLGENRHEYTWAKITEKPIAEVQKVIEEKIKLFGSHSQISS